MTARDPQLPYTAAERLRSFAVSAEAQERFSALAARYWEWASYGALLVAAIVLRWYNLGARAMHHDESLHANYSFDFKEALDQVFTFGTANTATWQHVPFMHGPFQFIGNGFIMWVFRDGDYQARMLAAIMGTGMVLLPLLLRKQLGVFGALAASAFIAFSPTLTYYSRFTREDIYTAFWTLGLVIFIWRYLASAENRWLYLAAGFMSLSFLTKEIALVTAIGFLLFLEYLLARRLAEQLRESSSTMTDLEFAALSAALIPVAWIAAIAWPFITDLRAKYKLDQLPVEGNILIVLGTLAAPSLAALAQLPLGDTWALRAVNSGTAHSCSGGLSAICDKESGFAYAAIFLLLGTSLSIGLLWNPRVWLIAAAAFWTPYVLLSTTFFTNWPGFFSVLWGSWDYWLSQQDVARGNQPIYYYFITTPVYEFLPLGLSVAAMLYYGVRGQLHRALIVAGVAALILAMLVGPSGPHILKASMMHVWAPFTLLIAVSLILPMGHFERFLIYWVLLSYFSLTVASEKMPWLNVHIAVALCILAGKFVGDVLGRSDLRGDLPSLERLAPFFYAAVASALCIVVFVVIGPFQAASVGGWALAIVAGVAVWWAATGYSRHTAIQVALVGAVAAFSVFSLRAGVLASWGHPDNPYVGQPGDVATRDHGEVPIELLVYTQSSGDIPVLRDRIAQYARMSGLGDNVEIVVDAADGFSWPWAWYLRNYKHVAYPDLTNSDYTPPPNAIVLAKQENASRVRLTGDYDPGVPFHHRRWFPEEYRTRDGTYTTHNFFGDLFAAGKLGDWLDFWVRRTLPANEPGTVDAVAFFPKGAGVPTQPAGPTVRIEGNQLVIGGQGLANGQLSEPADVAFGPDGSVYVADTRNNRVQKYDAQGNFVAAAGGFNTTNVRFTEPWSIAVGNDGSVYVADTWAHRIVKLDSDLNQIMTWGSGCTTVPDCNETELYGPRDITVAPNGNVLITDTGNARVIEFTPDGQPVRAFGQKGTSGAPLEFNEPVGVLVAASGDIYVGDFWNRRIVVLDGNLNEIRVISVDAWGSQAVSDRAYMALLADGRLLATDPEHGRVLVFAPNGSPAGAYDMPREGTNPFARPVGVASNGTSVLVSDSAAGVVRKIPVAEIAP